MKSTRILEHTLTLTLGAAIAGTTYVVAAPADPVPSGRIIPYEGYVEIDGVPLNGEGRKMCFRLYSAPRGGEPFWQSGPMDVVFTHGTFSVNLGSGTRLTEQAFSTASLHLGVELLAAGSATCSADRSGELTNRQQLVNPWLASNGPAFISGTNEGTGSAGVLLGQPPRTIGGVREAGGVAWQTNTGAHPFGGGGDKTAIVLRSAIGGGDATELVIENGDDADDTIRLQAPGGVNISGNQSVGGTLSVSGTFVSGAATINGNHTVNGSQTLTGDVTIGGNLRTPGNTWGNSPAWQQLPTTSGEGTPIFCPNGQFVCGLSGREGVNEDNFVSRMWCCAL